nr:speckle-type POZ protein B-like [Parasteatoda tepidariorum]
MNMKLTINHLFDDSLFREYKQDSLSVEKMGIVTVANEIFKSTYYDNGVRKSRPNVFTSDFNLNCSLMLYDHFNSPANYYKSMRSLKNLQKFATDFNCLYQSGQPTIQKVVEDVGRSAKRAKKRVAEKECVQTSAETPTVQQSGNLLNDVEIIVDNQMFFAHKSILAAHSPLFFQMLCHESKTNVIDISGFSTETTGCFIKYLYSGEIDDKSWTTIQELYSMAFKYDVHTLMRDCGEISSTFLSIDTVCEILKMAYEYRDDFLKLEATKFALKHIKELILKVEWKDMINVNPHIGYDVMKKYVLK